MESGFSPENICASARDRGNWLETFVPAVNYT